MMIKAMLVTPLPPQPTGLADYAMRILALTKDHVEWTVAYPSAAQPLNGIRCIPISELCSDDFDVPVVYQLGNSPHCEEVIEVFLLHGGTALFHETNMHHVLRNMADKSGKWKSYYDHVKYEYGEGNESFVGIMERKAKNFSEYDSRLKANPLVGKLAAASKVMAVLSTTAQLNMEKYGGDVPVVRMGFLPDFFDTVKSHSRKSKTIVIGIAGTFNHGRNWEKMVQAVGMLRKTVDCRLLVAGAGWPDSNQGWIHVAGRLSDLKFRELIATFDIAIDLRHHTCGETSGSMMDILGNGIPAVVTAEGTFRDIPADAVLRVPAESGAGGAYAALRYLLNNPDIHSSISQSALEYFLKISDRAKCLEEWLLLLERSRNEY